MSFGERQRIEHRIAILIEKADALQDDELKSEVSRYLCILSSGFVEVACRDIVQKYVASRSSPEVQRFVRAYMTRFRNPRKQQIINLYSSLDPEKAQQLESIIDEELWEAISSIMGQRNVLAHGGSSGISLARIKDYYQRASKLLKQIENEFL